MVMFSEEALQLDTVSYIYIICCSEVLIMLSVLRKAYQIIIIMCNAVMTVYVTVVSVD